MERSYQCITGFFILLGMMMSATAWTKTEETTAAAGQVVIVSGPLQAVNVQNQTRTLTRGANFYPGESLTTGTNSIAQVRFSDGTVMALNPNTQIKVDEYEYKKDDDTDKSTVSLIKGGFRALTGLISKNNPKAYKIETPVAVIGVRGTNFSGVLDEGELYAGVWKGSITVNNDKGSISLGEGEDYSFTLVKSKDEAPIGLLQPPEQLVGRCGIRQDHGHASRSNF